MQIFVRTDNNIDGHERFAHWVESEVGQTLSQFGSAINRVDVYLKDESAGRRGGDHILCVMEARSAGLQPIVASHRDGTSSEAVTGAVAKLKRTLESARDRFREHKAASPIRNDAT